MALWTGLLTGCGSQLFLPGGGAVSGVTLPAPGPAATQPAGAYQTETVAAALYYPDAGRSKLVRTTRQIAVGVRESRVKAIVSALLETPGETSLTAIFDRWVRADVIVCRDTVTVNLSADESEFDEQTVVVAAAAITATLTQVSGVTYVRLLFDGREMAERGVLGNPMAVSGQSLDVLWLLHEKLLENPAAAGKSNELLYFKDYSGQFLISEVRSLAVTATPVQDIISELKKGPRNSGEMTAVIPKTMMLDEHAFQQDEDGNETLILRLSCPNYETMDNQSLLLLLASLVESLCGRLPRVVGIQIYLNGVLQENVPGVGTVAGGLLTPALFNGLIGQIVTLYLRDPGESLLVPVKRAMAQNEFNQPRCRILEMMRGPLTAESGGAAAIFPDGVTQDDLLGVWVDSGCMYVNFSQNMQDLCRSANVDERTLVYGVVNTMADFYNVRQVQILIEGGRVKSLAGLIAVETPLLPNPGIVTGSRGA